MIGQGTAHVAAQGVAAILRDALAAAQMLTDLGNDGMAKALVALLERGPDLVLNADMLRLMRRVAPALATEQAGWLFDRMQAEDAGPVSAYAAALCTLLETTCGRNPARFDELVGREGAPSHAHYALEDTKEVGSFLSRLAEVLT